MHRAYNTFGLERTWRETEEYHVSSDILAGLIPINPTSRHSSIDRSARDISALISFENRTDPDALPRQRSAKLRMDEHNIVPLCNGDTDT